MMPAISDQDMNAMLAEDSRVSFLLLLLLKYDVWMNTLRSMICVITNLLYFFFYEKTR